MVEICVAVRNGTGTVTVSNVLHAVKEWAKEHVTQEKIAEGGVVKTLRPKVPTDVISNSRGAHYL